MKSLEGAVLENLHNSWDEFYAYRHEDYWRCIDTYRDLQMVNKDIEEKKDCGMNHFDNFLKKKILVIITPRFSALGYVSLVECSVPKLQDF